jgi:HEAT repeat protein
MRAILPSLLVLALGLSSACPAFAADKTAAAPEAPAAEAATEADVLAAARAADLFYQRQVQRLIGMLESKDVAVRIEAISLIGRLQDPALVPNLLPWLQSSNRTPEEIVATTCAIPTDGGQAAIPALKGLLKNENASVRVATMNALTRLQSIATADYMGRSSDPETAIRGSSASNLGVLNVADAAPILLKHLALDGKPHVRRMCVISLGLLGDRANGPAIAAALADSNPGVRRYAAEALVKINYTPAIPNLLMAMEANIASDHIAHCLQLMTKQDFGFSSRANPLARGEAIEKGFAWWTANSKELGQ